MNFPREIVFPFIPWSAIPSEYSWLIGMKKRNTSQKSATINTNYILFVKSAFGIKQCGSPTPKLSSANKLLLQDDEKNVNMYTFTFYYF